MSAFKKLSIALLSLLVAFPAAPAQQDLDLTPPADTLAAAMAKIQANFDEVYDEVFGVRSVALGGTGASSASAARTSLGLAIGTNVEAWDADLDTFAGLSPTNNDVLQRKSGAWVNRSIAQLLSDLGLAASATTDTTNASNINSGTLAAGRLPALTGDVTSSAGSASTTIATGVVTDTKASLATKPAVTVVATSNQTLSGTPTIDGQATADGSLILATAQSAGAENGPWVAHSGAWTRPTWYPSGGTTQGVQYSTTLVRLGTTYQGSTWRLTTAAPITIDTTATAWSVTPLAINSSTTTGLLDGTSVLTTTETTTQNDFNPTNFSIARSVRATGSASIGVTGFAAATIDGKSFIYRNATTDYLRWIPNESTASSAANRVRTPRGLPIFLMPGDSVTLSYDTTLQRWRVTECPSCGQAMGLTQFDDFITTPGSFTTNQTGTGATTGGTAIGVDTTFRYVGALGMAMGTTTTGRSTIGTLVSGAIVPTLGPALAVARAKIATAVDGTDTFACVYGFVDATTWTDGAAWEYRWTGSAPEWSQTRMAGGAATRSNTNSPSTGTGALWLLVFMNANWSRADYIYSSDGIAFTVADSPTTGLPSNTQLTGFGANCTKSAGTNARSSEVDFLGYRVDQTR